jgi:DNA modification methylase
MHQLSEPGYTLYCADCLDVLAEMEENSIDAVIVDPP